MGASSKKRWNRCSDWRSASCHSRSGDRSRTTERVWMVPSSACTTLCATATWNRRLRRPTMVSSPRCSPPPWSNRS
ncbi:hypothetical protein ACHMW5_29930 [Azospirillum melinis]|uniref:hypothetical protein n=1 Tax=Azospirillum melinis TaxID=328839 RepID=UPI003757E68E